MSYSRWMNSVWYTYWESQPKEDENRDTALFTICSFDGNITFTAKEIRDDINKCIGVARKQHHDLSELDFKELELYLMRFIEDINEEYPISN